MESNGLLGIIIGGAIVIGFFWYFYSIAKKENRPLGEVLSYKAVWGNETILMGLTFLVYISEALTASTVSAGQHTTPNILARIMLHLAIAIGGWVCELTLMRDFASVFEKDLDRPSLIARLIVVASVLYLAIRVPFYNVELVASNLNQYPQYSLYFYTTICFWLDKSTVYQHYGYPATYDPWVALEPILQASVIGTFITIFYSFISGVRNVSSSERRSLLFTTPKKEDDKKGEKKGEEKDKDKGGEKKDTTNTLENLSFLLKRLGYNDADRVEKLAKDAAKNHKTHNKGADEAKMTIRIANLRNDAHKIDAGTFGKFKDKESANADLKQRIWDLFNGRVKESDLDKRGLGITTIKPEAGE